MGAPSDLLPFGADQKQDAITLTSLVQSKDITRRSVPLCHQGWSRQWSVHWITQKTVLNSFPRSEGFCVAGGQANSPLIGGGKSPSLGSWSSLEEQVGWVTLFPRAKTKFNPTWRMETRPWCCLNENHSTALTFSSKINGSAWLFLEGVDYFILSLKLCV